MNETIDFWFYLEFLVRSFFILAIIYAMLELARAVSRQFGDSCQWIQVSLISFYTFNNASFKGYFLQTHKSPRPFSIASALSVVLIASAAPPVMAVTAGGIDLLTLLVIFIAAFTLFGVVTFSETDPLLRSLVLEKRTREETVSDADTNSVLTAKLLPSKIVPWSLSLWGIYCINSIQHEGARYFWPAPVILFVGILFFYCVRWIKLREATNRLIAGQPIEESSSSSPLR